MSSSIDRAFKNTSVDVTANTDTSEGFHAGSYAGGQFRCPAGPTGPVTFEAQDSTGAWHAINDDSDAAESQTFTADGAWVPIPERVFLAAGAVRFKLAAVWVAGGTIQVALKG